MGDPESGLGIAPVQGGIEGGRHSRGRYAFDGLEAAGHGVGGGDQDLPDPPIAARPLEPVEAGAQGLLVSGQVDRPRADRHHLQIGSRVRVGVQQLALDLVGGPPGGSRQQHHRHHYCSEGAPLDDASQHRPAPVGDRHAIDVGPITGSLLRWPRSRQA